MANGNAVPGVGLPNTPAGGIPRGNEGAILPPNQPRSDVPVIPQQLLIIHFRLTEPDYGDEVDALTLPLLPEELTRPHPAKTQVTYTPGGAFVDDFGLALPLWTISGHTGWRVRRVDGEQLNGYTAWLRLQDFIRYYFEQNKSRLQEGDEPLELYFYDFIHDDHWQIQPDGLPTLRHHREQALWIRYELRFTGLQRLSDARALTTHNAMARYLANLRTQNALDILLRKMNESAIAMENDAYLLDLAASNPAFGAGFAAYLETAKGIISQAQSAIAVPLEAIQQAVIAARGIANNLLTLIPGVKPPAFLASLNRLNNTIFAFGALNSTPALGVPSLQERFGQLQNAFSSGQHLIGGVGALTGSTIGR